MEFEVKERIVIPDGMHEGRITRIDYRETPFKYTDIYIEEAKTKLELKFGCPTNVSTDSKLGKLLAKFTTIKAKMRVNPEVILKDKEVIFMTMQEEGDDGKSYTRIVDGSVKPKVETESV